MQCHAAMSQSRKTIGGLVYGPVPERDFDRRVRGRCGSAQLPTPALLDSLDCERTRAALQRISGRRCEWAGSFNHPDLGLRRPVHCVDNALSVRVHAECAAEPGGKFDIQLSCRTIQRHAPQFVFGVRRHSSEKERLAVWRPHHEGAHVTCGIPCRASASKHT